MSSYSNMNPSDVFILAAPTVGSFLIDVTLSFVISGAFVTFIYFLFKYDSEGFEQLEEQTEEVENMNDEITTKLQEEEEIQKDEQTKEEVVSSKDNDLKEEIKVESPVQEMNSEEDQ